MIIAELVAQNLYSMGLAEAPKMVIVKLIRKFLVPGS